MVLTKEEVFYKCKEMCGENIFHQPPNVDKIICAGATKAIYNLKYPKDRFLLISDLSVMKTYLKKIYP